jgi:hypothetical protein
LDNIKSNRFKYSKRFLGGAGTQTAALAFGGQLHLFTGATEEYDGTTWTAGGSLNTARNDLGGAGTQTAALAFGGNTPPLQEQQKNIMDQVGHPGNLNTARGLAGAGIQTAALAFGGSYHLVTGATEEYDGTTWTTSNKFSNSKNNLAGAGTQTAALAFGGYTTLCITAATEEWTGAGAAVTKTITVS